MGGGLGKDHQPPTVVGSILEPQSEHQTRLKQTRLKASHIYLQYIKR
jgi:hypothetical protein